MNRKSMLTIGITAVWLSVLGGLAISAQDKYTVRVPGGLAFAEFRGYESWQSISISRSDKVVAVILGNPAMIDAYKAGFPGNGKPVPDGAKMAKVHWIPKPNEFFPDATVPGNLLNVDFMVRDRMEFKTSRSTRRVLVGQVLRRSRIHRDGCAPSTSGSSPRRRLRISLRAPRARRIAGTCPLALGNTRSSASWAKAAWASCTQRAMSASSAPSP